MPKGKEAGAQQLHEGLLGLRRLPKRRYLELRGGWWFERGDVRIHLGVEDGFQPARKAHPALLVDDLDTLVARLKEAGIIVRPEQPLEGYKRVYADDPFGNRIELMERLNA